MFGDDQTVTQRDGNQHEFTSDVQFKKQQQLFSLQHQQAVTNCLFNVLIIRDAPYVSEQTFILVFIVTLKLKPLNT